MSTNEIRFEPVPPLIFVDDTNDETLNGISEHAKSTIHECPFVIRCINADGDENIVETCHVPLDYQTNSEISGNRARKKFGSFAFGHRKFSSTYHTTEPRRTRKSLPLNIGTNKHSEHSDITASLRAAYQKKFKKASRHNSVVPQVSQVLFYLSLTIDIHAINFIEH
ncbi:uncharacterized protein CDAR_545721 [Caerostris darwini]|uniref:Uncharacterized protein n=1 Tax=Caerostris darwini TaxID=1538125 RepID=A0AAV4WX90_9ARAC|nr:uncharacterized protein CDAR_545721 [Caerostris darwini]